MTTSAHSLRPRLALALLGLLAAFHLVNNWLWLATNRVAFGADRMYHLVSSLRYYDVLRHGVSAANLFSALTLSDYYPPLVHLTVVVFYGLFGLSADVAALSNGLYLVILLLALYGLGDWLAGPWTGLLSAAIGSFLPIVFAMSRYLYIDFALTALVAANVCLLLRSDRFRRRGTSLLYGASLGLGMLVKWTFVVFALPPLVVVLASPGLLPALRSALRPGATSGRHLLAAALAGLALTAVWFLPNMEATARLPLGYALVPLSFLAWTFTLYFLLATLRRPLPAGAAGPAGRGTHLLAALGLASCIAAAWYLTRIDFLGDFWLNAYGKPTGRSWGFVDYVDFLAREQLSPLFVVALLAALAGLAWSRWRRARAWRGFLALGVDGWALALWAVVPYVVFSTRVSIVHSRYIMPLLPPLGLAIALGVSRIPRRGVRLAAITLLLAAAVVQFAVISFDALAPWQARLPVFAQGLSIQAPASGRNDPGYRAVPDVLRAVDEQRQVDSPWLGLLANLQQVNSQHFVYEIYTRYPHIQLKELATVGQGQGIYPTLFECDFVLLVDPPPHYARRPETEATIERLLANPDDSFHRVFEPAQAYPLPDGRRLLLYRRRFEPAALADVASYQALAAVLAVSAGPGDSVAVFPPQGVYALARFDAGSSLSFYPLPAALAGSALPDLPAGNGRQWVVVDTQAGSAGGEVPATALAAGLYPASAAWFGPLQLRLYGPPAPAGPAASMPEEKSWQGGIALQGLRTVDASLPLGQVLRLELVWQAAEPPAEPYKVFVHLLDSGGRLVAQHDGEPLDGTRPTTTWQPGEAVTDRLGLWLPPDLPSGDYRLVAGLYHAASGDRLPGCCPAGDALPLVTLRIEAGTARILEPAGN